MPSGSPAIRAEIGADVGPLNAADADVIAATEKIAGGMEHRLLSTRHVATALATALGLNFEKIAENFARLWTGVSVEQEQGFKDLEEWSTRAADSTIENMRRMATEETKYQLALQERDRLQKRVTSGNPREEGPGPSFSAYLKTFPTLGPFPNPYYDEGKQVAAELALQKTVGLAKDTVELNKQSDIVAEHEKKMREEAAAYYKEGNLSLEKQMDLSRLLEKSGDQLTQQEKDRLSLYALESKQLTAMAELRKLASTGYQNLLPADKAWFDELVKETAELQKQIDKKKGLTTATVDQAAAEQEVAAAIGRAIAAAQHAGLAGLSANEQDALSAWIKGGKIGPPPDIERQGNVYGSLADPLVDFAGIALGPVRKPADFARASDDVIKEEIRRYQQAIAQVRNAPSFGAPEVASNFFARDKAVDQITTNLNEALAELQQRGRLRSTDYSTALRGYQGDPLNFDNLYHAAQQNLSEQERTTRAVQDLTQKLSQGIPVISVNGYVPGGG